MAKYRKPGQLPKMILDWNMCIRVESGEADLAGESIPYSCKRCLTKNKQNGILRLAGHAIPTCDSHEIQLDMTPSKGERL